MEIKVDLSKSGLTMEEIRQKKLEIDTALERLWSGKRDFYRVGKAAPSAR